MTELLALKQQYTPAVQDYLKAIYLLQQESGEVSTSALAEQLGDIRPPSVSGMIKRLAELGLVTHEPYQGVRLTVTGERVALAVLRHHRLIELFLVNELGYGWDEVHEEAEALEHYISEKFATRIAERLGDPAFDPHGDPIPSKDGRLPAQTSQPLSELSIGTRASVVRVGTQDAARLRYIAALGLIPGAQIEVTAVAPFEGPISVRTPTTVQAFDRHLANTIHVAPLHSLS
jgi:DtxR family transcriptional regulator, Mn-dependent transcriptional regulator